MSPIKNSLLNNKVKAKKRLGQNFLINQQALEKIISSANLNDKDTVLEIGAGTANLSCLIAPCVKEFYALEKDRTLKKILSQKLSNFKNTKIIFSDILRFELKTIAEDKKIKVIGNLPYYITSSILQHLISQKSYIKSILITVQKEVAHRIVSPPGSKDYGRLSCLLQYYTKPSLIEVFPKHFFMPKPEVDSALILLEILKTPSVKVNCEKLFFKVIKASFAQRRKTLLNSLSSNLGLSISKDNLRNVFKKLNLSLSIRGECLSLNDFANLTDELYKNING